MIPNANRQILYIMKYLRICVNIAHKSVNMFTFAIILQVVNYMNGEILLQIYAFSLTRFLFEYEW